MKKLVIPSTLSEAARVLQTVIVAAQDRGFSESELFAIRLSLDEALTNAVRHGSANDASRFITVEYTVNKDEVRVKVCDQGPGFRPEHLPDPTSDEFLELPHGRGVMLMKAYMTEVSFSDRGNCVTLVKTRGFPLPCVVAPLPSGEGGRYAGRVRAWQNQIRGTLSPALQIFIP